MQVETRIQSKQGILYGKLLKVHVAVQDLTTWNHLSYNTIFVGQELSITAPYYQNRSNPYMVKSGDSLSSILKKYHVTIAELKSTNKLTSNIVKIGQVLTIPTTTMTAFGFLQYVFNKQSVNIPRTVATI
jgi:LysM repeat protein